MNRRQGNLKRGQSQLLSKEALANSGGVITVDQMTLGERGKQISMSNIIENYNNAQDSMLLEIFESNILVATWIDDLGFSQKD